MQLKIIWSTAIISCFAADRLHEPLHWMTARNVVLWDCSSFITLVVRPTDQPMHSICLHCRRYVMLECFAVSLFYICLCGMHAVQVGNVYKLMYW